MKPGLADACRRVYTGPRDKFKMVVQRGERTMMRDRLPWESMRVTYLGNVAEIVRQGGGKITTITGDPGEPRKVPPTG